MDSFGSCLGLGIEIVAGAALEGECLSLIFLSLGAVSSLPASDFLLREGAFGGGRDSS